MPLGLLALAIGGFGIGSTEFVTMGLLPELAADFSVTESTAGRLITGYALSVVVGALVVTAAVTRLPHETVLLALMCLFIAGNLISALSGSYDTMLLGRVIAALCHGAFFGIGAVVAAGLVEPAKKAGAIALMFAGRTAANVLGVPFGTFLGRSYGWRSAFWAITVIGVVALIGVAALVPRETGIGEEIDLRRELRAFRSPQVWLSIATTALGFGGLFGAFTYIAFTLTDVSGFASSSVPWLLVLFGGGLFIGNYLGGRAADRNLTATLLTLLGASTVVLVVFALTAESRPASATPRPSGPDPVSPRSRWSSCCSQLVCCAAPLRVRHLTE